MAQIEPVGRCNLACRMCTVPARPGGNLLMSLDRFAGIVDELVAGGVAGIHLQGLGEPLLNPAFFEMVELAVARGLRVTTNTNLTLLTRARAERMARAGLAEISISLDAAAREAYESIRLGADFHKVIRNVHRLVDARRRLSGPGPLLRFVLVLMRRNLEEVPKVVTLAAECGVEAVLVQRIASTLDEPTLPARYASTRAFLLDEDLRLDPTSAAGAADAARATEVFDATSTLARTLGVTLHLPRLVPRSQGQRCDWPSRELYITAAGELLPCCMVGTPDRASFGSTQGTSVAAVWHGRVAADFRRRLASDAPPDVCRGCALFAGTF